MTKHACLILVSFGIFMMSGPAFAIDYGQCQQQLNQSALNPICSIAACESLLPSVPAQQFCSTQSVGVPIQAVVCKNSQTGEERYETLSQEIKECATLNQQDANWNLTNCYCCC